MKPEHLPARRGLAPLDDTLSEPAHRCAQHLRELRDRIGLSSEELARELTIDGLRVDKTRLSKFLNGREVPRYAFAARIHQVLAEREQRVVDPADVASTRELIYAAAVAAGPLQARDFELAVAREKLEATRRHAAEQLGELRQELDAERAKRQAAEDALAALHGQAREQAERLRLERDAAEQRVAEVEEEIRRAEALLRLQDRDARTMSDLSDATAVELLLWDEDADASDPDDLHQALVSWRDYGHDEQANQLMARLARSSDIKVLFKLYSLFLTGGRRQDADRLLTAVAVLHDPVTLFYFTEDLRHEPEEVQRLDPRNGLASLVPPLPPFGPDPQDQWYSNVIPAMAASASMDTVLLFHRACEENSAHDVAKALRQHVLARRPEPEPPLAQDALAFWEEAREEQRIHDRLTRHSRNPLLKWLYGSPSEWPPVPKRRGFRFSP